jgi:hypothetical protein
LFIIQTTDFFKASERKEKVFKNTKRNVHLCPSKKADWSHSTEALIRNSYFAYNLNTVRL